MILMSGDLEIFTGFDWGSNEHPTHAAFEKSPPFLQTLLIRRGIDSMAALYPEILERYEWLQSLDQSQWQNIENGEACIYPMALSYVVGMGMRRAHAIDRAMEKTFFDHFVFHKNDSRAISNSSQLGFGDSLRTFREILELDIPEAQQRLHLGNNLIGNIKAPLIDIMISGRTKSPHLRKECAIHACILDLANSIQPLTEQEIGVWKSTLYPKVTMRKLTTSERLNPHRQQFDATFDELETLLKEMGTTASKIAGNIAAGKVSMWHDLKSGKFSAANKLRSGIERLLVSTARKDALELLDQIEDYAKQFREVSTPKSAAIRL